MRLAVLKRNTALGAALAVAAALAAPGGSLGGVGRDYLGADTSGVSACDSDGIDVEWHPVYDEDTAQHFADFTLSDIATECIGSSFEFSISEVDHAGERTTVSVDDLQLVTRYHRASDGEEVVRVRYRTQLPAKLVERIAIVIDG